MGLSALSSALSGLSISQQQISVISNNVANVGTPGFTRKILPQNAQAINGVGVGVAPGTIMRNVDLNLSRDLWTQVSAIGALDVKQSYLERIEQFHGPPDAELSIAAELGRLRSSFTELSNAPDDALLLAGAVNAAEDTANRVNALSNLITTQRNDAQTELSSSVTRLNDLLEQVAELNDQIRSNLNIGQTTAQLEDRRDAFIQEISGLIDISFFQRGDGVVVIQTNNGIELAGTTAQQLSFSPSPLSATSAYPDSVAALIVGDPDDPSSVDITGIGPGGKIGGLLELRDEIYPKQMAQLDEMAHKLALRFEAQGLLLFTGPAGDIPADTPPDPNADPVVPVEYVGFSATMRVNQSILDNHTLMQSGTYGDNIAPGSNAVIRRVLEFSFTGVDYLEAYNSDTTTGVDLQVPGGVADLQEWLGISATNILSGFQDLSSFADLNALVSAASGNLNDPNDVFRITISTPALGSVDIDIDLSDGTLPNPDPAGANAADMLASLINTAIGAAVFPAGLTASASVSSNGEIVITSNGTIAIDNTNPANAINENGLTFLGFTDNTANPQEPTNPYFQIAVGNGTLQTIEILPGEDETDLLAKLNAIDGVAAQLDANGFLQIRPGNDYTNPDFGGDIRLVGGPFETNGAAYTGIAPLRTAIDDGVNILSALFGTYTISGGVVEDESPINSIEYGSETSNGSGVFVSFRENFLGQGANVSTNVVGADSIIEYAQAMVNEHTQELIITKDRASDEDALRAVLETQLLNESAVNLDEELGNLVIVQNAYSASARVITAVDELFRELLNAV